ncbi:hypothetical protein JTE90_029381 [Oedothorax gibbosus]|uniref:RING-type E3 ubiquitin transferase n=1 Tax=Oedothorax gibbosus TaxID=931172 RepID=A0AAV6VQ81_9ARAC|nr:hypothetical protein JTE90_029381 [Oedothorax gibbosus]
MYYKKKMKSQQEECVLCCREIQIYAVGACDHHVCYECSTRMRVLLETNECPICRSDVPVVIFTHVFQLFSSVDKNFTLINRKFNIVFQDEMVSSAFDDLLENKCKSCEEVFPTFNKLKEHVRRKHELHYCELCTENLKIFTFERKCYSRKDLARHKRVGDPDETSHRGHPSCEFCDLRYVDKDELFRHLRREHYFCHFCDADGKHTYYKDYDYLKDHFRKDHYLCEEGDCLNEKFIGAFRSEIDLKAHIAVHHSKNKSKQEVKQTRLLEFEFAPPPRYNSGSSSPRAANRYAQHRRRNEDDISSRDQYKNNQQKEAENLNTQSMQDFPYLSEETNRAGGEISLSTFNRNAPNPYRKNVMSAEDFPALCANSALEPPSNQNKKPSYSAPVQAQQRNASKQNNKFKAGEPENGDRFSNQKGKWLNKKNPNFEEDFPSLEVRKAPLPSASSVPKTVSSAQANKVVNSVSSSQVPKSGSLVPSKKKNFNLEEEFPSLEVRKNPPSATPLVPKTVSSSSTASSKPTDSASKPQVTDQFVVIKTKSKKKKPKVPSPSDYDVEEEDSNPFQPLTRSNEEDPLMAKFKEHKVHSSFVTQAPMHKSNDYWELEPVKFDTDDFPPLAPEPVKKPPGFNAPEKPRPPPPGFSAISSKNHKPLSAKVKDMTGNQNNAHGGHKTLSSKIQEIVMGSQNGVKNSTCDELQPFVNPPKCEVRNNELIQRISDIIDGNSDLFQSFKELSGKFRNASLSAAEYHSKCLEILGDNGLLEIFPELVALLPDIKKQQELLAIHNVFLSHKSIGVFSKWTPKSASSLVSCNKCNQVLVVSDSKSHALSHE